MSYATVIDNSRVGGDFFRLSLRWEALEILPGQFIMLRVRDSLDPFLRRPFSVYDSTRTRTEVLYKVIGKGTAMLSALSAGERVDMLGPFGNGFPLPGKGKSLVMVAGGIGIAPFYLLARTVGNRGNPALLYGARGRAEAMLLKDFKRHGLRLRVTTEDGSVGVKGVVTDILREELGDRAVIYTCGPAGMLKEVSRVARERGVKCYVSLERAMACGIGVCLGCAVKTKKQPAGAAYSMVCSDGPVFDSEDIEWELF